MSDLVKYVLLIVTFAVLVSAHVTLVVGLARRSRPRSRALAALIIPPLAPYWGARFHMLVRTIVWCVGAAGYAAAWIVAR